LKKSTAALSYDLNQRESNCIIYLQILYIAVQNFSWEFL